MVAMCRRPHGRISIPGLAGHASWAPPILLNRSIMRFYLNGCRPSDPEVRPAEPGQERGPLEHSCISAIPRLWRRASNENANSLLRQYFRKGGDLSVEEAEVRPAADETNHWPRGFLGWVSVTARFRAAGEGPIGTVPYPRK